MRYEGAAVGVRVSVVCPAFVQTGIYDASLIANASAQEMAARVPFKMISAERAARAILRGVRRNRAAIIFPFDGRMFWRFDRLYPGLLASLARKTVSDFHAARIDKVAGA